MSTICGALRVLTGLALSAASIRAQSTPKILARLDDVAPKFSAATAKLTSTQQAGHVYGPEAKSELDAAAMEFPKNAAREKMK